MPKIMTVVLIAASLSLSIAGQQSATPSQDDLRITCLTLARLTFGAIEESRVNPDSKTAVAMYVRAYALVRNRLTDANLAKAMTPSDKYIEEAVKLNPASFEAAQAGGPARPRAGGDKGSTWIVPAGLDLPKPGESGKVEPVKIDPEKLVPRKIEPIKIDPDTIEDLGRGRGVPGATKMPADHGRGGG